MGKVYEAEDLRLGRHAARFFGTSSGTWRAMALDHSRLYVQDLGTQEIYSLQLQLQ
jgi:hypothetical protein